MLHMYVDVFFSVHSPWLTAPAYLCALWGSVKLNKVDCLRLLMSLSSNLGSVESITIISLNIVGLYLWFNLLSVCVVLAEGNGTMVGQSKLHMSERYNLFSHHQVSCPYLTLPVAQAACVGQKAVIQSGHWMHSLLRVITVFCQPEVKCKH